MNPTHPGPQGLLIGQEHSALGLCLQFCPATSNFPLETGARSTERPPEPWKDAPQVFWVKSSLPESPSTHTSFNLSNITPICISLSKIFLDFLIFNLQMLVPLKYCICKSLRWALWRKQDAIPARRQLTIVLESRDQVEEALTRPEQQQTTPHSNCRL